MVRAAFLAGLIAAAASGCTSGWSIHGQVVQGAIASAPGAPIGGAAVTLRCADSSVSPDLVVVSDEQGGFQLVGSGLGPRLDCALSVAKDGYQEGRFTVDEVCADEDDSGDFCAAGALQAELAPQ
ncbi:MAG: hypothetical protein NVS2B9_01400 [Myxococcales bacterium]